MTYLERIFSWPYRKMNRIIKKADRTIFRPWLARNTSIYNWRKINLCCGNTKLVDYCGIDFTDAADMVLDLSKKNLPFRNDSIDVIVCMSAINYFTRDRGSTLIQEVHRVLRPGGITRFGVQDMKSIAKRYVENDQDFFFQKLSNGNDRFEGPTIGDKFAAWFYGYYTAGGPGRYFYDFESLAYLFKNAGFKIVERRAYRESRLPEVFNIDNRPDQMLFLEAIK